MGDSIPFLTLDDDSFMTFDGQPDFQALGHPFPSSLDGSAVPSQQLQHNLEQRPPSAQRRAAYPPVSHKPNGLQPSKFNNAQPVNTFRPLASTYVTEPASQGGTYNV